jgi:hypothetical protein
LIRAGSAVRTATSHFFFSRQKSNIEPRHA